MGRASRHESYDIGAGLALQWEGALAKRRIGYHTARLCERGCLYPKQVAGLISCVHFAFFCEDLTNLLIFKEMIFFYLSFWILCALSGNREALYARSSRFFECEVLTSNIQ